MPGRLEFETEYENEAETLVKDMEFGKVYQFGGELQPSAEMVAGELGGEGKVEEKEVVVVEEGKKEGEGGEGEGEEKEGVTPDEPEGDLELKLSILEMFNERYDKRMAAKEIIFDRGLMNYKTVSRGGSGEGVRR